MIGNQLLEKIYRMKKHVRNFSAYKQMNSILNSIFFFTKMKVTSIRFIICLISFFSFNSFVIAQSTCEQNLKQAEELYTGGDYENSIQQIEALLKDCSLSSKREEVALEILTKSYLHQDNTTLAEKTVGRILKNNPYYELKESGEDEDFEILVKKFAAHPLFSIGARNTAMIPSLNTTQTYSITPNHFNYDASYTNNKTELLYYIIAEYEFKKAFSVNVDALFFNMSYNRSLTKNTDNMLTFKEDMSFIEIPLYLKEYFPLGNNILTYATIGTGYLKLTKANAIANISYFNEDYFTNAKTEFTSNDPINMLPQRNKNNFEWLVGAGIGYRFKNLGIFIDARYTQTVNSITSPSKRYSNATLVNNYFYVDNSIKLYKYEIGLSLSYTLKNSIKKIQ